MKTNLVWVSTESLSHRLPALFSTDRNFDVILHTYGNDDGKGLNEGHVYDWSDWEVGRYSFRSVWQPGEKLNVAGKILPGLLDGYHQFAFLDDDLTFTTDDLNRLFAIGEALRLPLYQPAITRGSFASHWFLLEGGESNDEAYRVRKVPFVEIMCPFFSRLAMEDCLPTFDINESGWGLDCYLWPKAVNGETYVIDAVPFGHYRQPARRARVLRNGLTPQQELWIQQVIDNPETARTFPPHPVYDSYI